MKKLKQITAVLVTVLSIVSMISPAYAETTPIEQPDGSYIFMSRLKHTNQFSFSDIDYIQLNFETDITDASFDGAVSFFNGGDSFSYMTFSTDSNSENTVRDGIVSIPITEPILSSMPYTDFYVSISDTDVAVIKSIDFFSEKGSNYLYTIYYNNWNSPASSTLFFDMICNNFIYSLNPDNSQNGSTIKVNSGASTLPFYSKNNNNSSPSGQNNPTNFDFCRAVGQIKSSETLFSGSSKPTDPWNDACTIETDSNTFPNIFNSSFIYAVYALYGYDDTKNIAEQSLAITVSDGNTSVIVPPVETISIREYLNIIYGGVTVEQILHSTFTDEQLASMTKKELLEVTSLISMQIERTFGTIENVMNGLDNMVKTNIDPSMSVDDLYVSAYLPEDMKKIVRSRFSTDDARYISFSAQSCNISLIEAYLSTTNNSDRYISSIADGQELSDRYIFHNSSASESTVTTKAPNNNKPHVSSATTATNSQKSGFSDDSSETENDNSDHSNSDNSSPDKKHSSKNNDKSSDTSSISDNRKNNIPKKSGGIEPVTSKDSEDNNTPIDVTPPTGDKTLSGLLSMAFVSLGTLLISKKRRH